MTLENLRSLRDDYSDDIPDEKAWGNFKVQRKWWQKLFFGLEDALKEGLIPDEIKDELAVFMSRYSSEEFHSQPLTTQSDLDNANALINRICGPRIK